jgi:uncharacterized protein
MDTDQQTLINRATGGRERNREDDFRPGWFYHLVDDPFWIYCQHHVSDEKAVDETTLYDEHLMQKGVEWEEHWVNKHFPDALDLKETWGEEGLQQTIQAMCQGIRAIHGASLWLLPEDVYGKADLLVRDGSHESDLGPYHYRVKEIKSSSSLKGYHKLQTALYNRILGEIQGYTPDTFEVVLGEDTEDVETSFHDVVDELEEQLEHWRRIRDGEVAPPPNGYARTGSPWRKYGNELLQECNDVTLIPGIGKGTRRSLKEEGITSYTDFIDLGEQGAIQRFGEDGKHYYWHAKAHQKGEPTFPPGTSASIKRRDRIVHFDVEDTTVVDDDVIRRSHTYMLGAALPDGTTRIWTAEGEETEKRMWEGFLDWLGDPSDVALYCWTMYEEGKIEQAAEDHPVLEDRLLEAKNALIDLKEEVKHQPYFPVPTYSIKSVAPVCGFNWSQDDVDGLSAGVMYKQWLETGDDSIIEKVEQYNKEDVLAMLAVDEYVSSNNESVSSRV